METINAYKFVAIFMSSFCLVLWIIIYLQHRANKIEISRMRRNYEKALLEKDGRICAGCGERKMTYNFYGFDVCSKDCEDVVETTFE